VTVDYVLEPIPADAFPIWKITLVHMPQLHPADAGVYPADSMDVFQGEGLQCCLARHSVAFLLMVGLLGHTKQSAQPLYRIFPR